MEKRLPARFSIQTKRLKLLPLGKEELDLLTIGRPQLEVFLGLDPSGLETSEVMRREMRDALKVWKKFVEEHPGYFAWGTNWEIILLKENRAIGGIGMNGLPDENGRVTLGYVVDNRYQNQGYATEALGGLVHWAFGQSELEQMEALTPIENKGSQRVLIKNGFKQLNRLDLEGIALFSWALSRASFLSIHQPTRQKAARL